MSDDDLVLSSWLSEVRRDIHRHPELGFRDERTASLVERALANMSIPSVRAAGTGVIGLIEGVGACSCVGLRADMDALPIWDAKEAPLRNGRSGERLRI